MAAVPWRLGGLNRRPATPGAVRVATTIGHRHYHQAQVLTVGVPAGSPWSGADAYIVDLVTDDGIDGTKESRCSQLDNGWVTEISSVASVRRKSARRSQALNCHRLSTVYAQVRAMNGRISAGQTVHEIEPGLPTDSSTFGRFDSWLCLEPTPLVARSLQHEVCSTKSAAGGCVASEIAHGTGPRCGYANGGRVGHPVWGGRVPMGRA